MNFLAHAYLSGSSDQVMLGNFVADFVKGKEADSWPRKVQKGLLLHREIDFFTDRHHLVTESKQLLWPRHRHYSSVIVDIFYDHFLARNWQEYSSTPLHDFAAHVYATIQRFDALLPYRAKQVLPRMIANNWLVNYGTREGINRAMQGMAKRASFRSEMAGAIDDLEKDYEIFACKFREFFPELARHATSYLCNLEDVTFIAQ